MKLKNKTKRVNKKKRAQVVNMGVFFYAALLMVIIIIVYFIMFKVAAKRNVEKMTGSTDIFAGSIYSSAYLKTPVEVKGINMSMSNLMRLAEANPLKYRYLFVKKTKEFWEGGTVPDNICFYVAIKGKILYYTVAESGCSYTTSDWGMREWVGNSNIPLKRFRTLVPSFTEGEFIELYVYYDVEGLRKAYGIKSQYNEYKWFMLATPGAGAVALATSAVGSLYYRSQAP